MFHYSMKSPDGHEMWGRFVYREIVAPEKIVFDPSKDKSFPAEMTISQMSRLFGVSLRQSERAQNRQHRGSFRSRVAQSGRNLKQLMELELN